MEPSLAASPRSFSRRHLAPTCETLFGRLSSDDVDETSDVLLARDEEHGADARPMVNETW